MLSFKKGIEHSEIGFARHKMIYDEAGKPVDYCFLAVNSAFEKLTGLKKEALLNQRVTDVLPKTVDDDFDWIGYYATIAKTGQKRVIEQYSYAVDKTFRVEAFSCEPGYFTTLFTEITHEREMVEASKAFLDDGEVANTYEAITQRMMKIAGAHYVALNIFLDEDGHFITVAI